MIDICSCFPLLSSNSIYPSDIIGIYTSRAFGVQWPKSRAKWRGDQWRNWADGRRWTRTWWAWRLGVRMFSDFKRGRAGASLRGKWEGPKRSHRGTETQGGNRTRETLCFCDSVRTGLKPAHEPRFSAWGAAKRRTGSVASSRACRGICAMSRRREGGMRPRCFDPPPHAATARQAALNMTGKGGATKSPPGGPGGR